MKWQRVLRARQPRRQATARWQAAAVAVALVAAVHCSKKGGVVEPPPLTPGAVHIEGNRIQWTTDRDARASVRYGYTRGAWDHIAYPDAAGRADRTARRSHDVALLDLRPGQTLYFQAVSEAAGAAPVYTSIDSFTPVVPAPGPQLTATMIHIGFGDSHLITMPTTGKRFLYDAGGRQADESVITYLQAHNVTTIDAALATHVHEDHMGGFAGGNAPGDHGVLGAFPPAVLFDSPVKAEGQGRAVYAELLNSLPAATTRVVVSRGQSSLDVPELRLDPEVRILVVNSGTAPEYQPDSYDNTNINNESIVMRFSYGDVDFMIGGDCEVGCEANALAYFSAAALELEYFKATHHGLSDANSPAWVNALRPRIMFIPNTQAVWDPPQSFPGAIASTQSKAAGIGAHVYVIDEAATLDRFRSSGRQYNVTFATDGDSYEVRVEQATQPTPSITAQTYGCVAHAPGGEHEHHREPSGE
jgi:hypothetical protein